MTIRRTTMRLILLVARITGTLLLAFLLFMLVGHLVGDANGPEGMHFTNHTERSAFAFFPCGTILGLALAYRWELFGGLLAVGSIAMLFVLLPRLEEVRFLLMMLPGLLYIVHGLLTRRGARA